MPEAVVLQGPVPKGEEFNTKKESSEVASAQKKMPSQTQIPKKANFLLGGLAGMGATSVVQPLDLVKTRMQLAGEGAKGAQRNTLSTLFGVIRSEGFFALYNG
jgi:solute carrier family 25 oxoglutarate transporter 11